MERRFPGLPAVVIVGLLVCGLVGAANSFGPSTATAGERPSTTVGLGLAVPLTSASLSISPDTLDLGQSISVQTTPDGGTAPYTYEYFGLPSGCSVEESQSFQCQPSVAGSFSVYVNITDADDNQTNSNTVSLIVEPSLQVSLSLNPGTLTEGQSLQVSTSVSGGSGQYSYEYTGLPSGCQGYNSASFSCTPSSTGGYSVGVNVTDTNGGYVDSNTQNVQVNSASSGGDGGSGGGNNSSNPLSGLLSGLSGFVSLIIIFGIIGFVTWILLIVGVWVVAVVLIRRLPKNGAKAAPAAAPMVKCGSCSATIPGGSKFCPECGASTVPKSG